MLTARLGPQSMLESPGSLAGLSYSSGIQLTLAPTQHLGTHRSGLEPPFGGTSEPASASRIGCGDQHPIQVVPCKWEMLLIVFAICFLNVANVIWTLTRLSTIEFRPPKRC